MKHEIESGRFFFVGDRHGYPDIRPTPLKTRAGSSMKPSGESCGSLRQPSRSFPAMWPVNSSAGDAASHRKHSRRSRTTSSRGNFPDPAKWIGRFCARSKVFPRFSSSGTVPRRTLRRIAPFEDRIFLQGITADEDRLFKSDHAGGKAILSCCTPERPWLNPLLH